MRISVVMSLNDSPEITNLERVDCGEIMHGLLNGKNKMSFEFMLVF
jgi:hypothetical protein